MCYRQHGLAGKYSEPYIDLLYETLRELKQSTPNALIQHIFQNEDNQAKLLPVLWYLIATQQVGVDLNQPITMKSTIWFKK